MGAPAPASCTGTRVSARSGLRTWLNVIPFNQIYRVLVLFPERLPGLNPKTQVEIVPTISAPSQQLLTLAEGSPRAPGSRSPPSQSAVPQVLLLGLFC